MMLTTKIKSLDGIYTVSSVFLTLILSGGVSAASINDFQCPSGTTALPLSQMSIVSATDGWLNPPEDDAERLINGQWDTWASGFGSPVSAVIDLGGTVNVAQVQVFTASGVSGAIQIEALGSGVLIQPISLTQDYEWLGTDMLSASTDQIQVSRDGPNENINELRVCLGDAVVTPSPTPQPTPAPTTPNPTPQAPVSNPTNPPCTGGGTPSGTNPSDFSCGGCLTLLPVQSMTVSSASGGWLNPPENDAARLIDSGWAGWAPGYSNPATATFDLGGVQNVHGVYLFSAGDVGGDIGVSIPGVPVESVALSQDYTWLGATYNGVQTESITLSRDQSNENAIELRVCLGSSVPEPPTPPPTPNPSPQPSPSPTTPNPTPQAPVVTPQPTPDPTTPNPTPPVFNPTNPPCTGGSAPSGTNPSDFACGDCSTLLPVQSMTVSSASGGWLDPPEDDAERLIDSGWGGWAPGYGNPATATFDLGGVQNVQGVYLFTGGNVAGDIGVSIPGVPSESIALNQEYTWLGATFNGVQTGSVTLTRDQSNENAIELRVCLGSDGPGPTTPSPTPSPTTGNGGGPVTDDMPVTDTNGNLVTGQAYANANSGVELSSGFGTWSTKVGVVGTLTQACIDMHDSYWVEFEGKVYHTWHPVAAVHPATNEGCVWGHEHGNNPFASPLFEYAGGWPAFGSLMEMFNENELQGGADERLEDHVGHKVTVSTYRATLGNPPNSDEALFDAGFFCHFLSKIHQGAYSNDALTNQLHEYFVAAQCDDNPVGLADRINSDMSVEDRFANPNNIHTQFALKSMLPFGAADKIKPMCNSSSTPLDYFGGEIVSELDSPPPLSASVTPGIQVDGQDGALNHRELGCMDKGAAKFEHGLPDTINQLDLWTQPRNIKSPQGASVSFQVYYNVKDATRIYDEEKGTIRYTVDICNDLLNEFGGSFRFCEGVTPNMDWFDPDSPFKGALRSVHFKTLAVWDNSASRPEAFCTNSLGRQQVNTDANGNCADGYVLQKIKAFQGHNNWFGYTNPATGITGNVVGALYVVGQNMEYPLQTADGEPYQLVSGNAQSGLIKPFDTSTWPPEMFNLAQPRNCPLKHVSVSASDEQDAYCTFGIGFEKVIDHRYAVPPGVASVVEQGMNDAVHAPN